MSLESAAAAAWNEAKGVEADTPLSTEPGEIVVGDEDASEVVDAPEGEEAPAAEAPETPAEGDETVDKPTAAEDKVAAAKKAAEEKAAKEKAAEDPNDFSKVPEKDAQGRTNRIPHPRVKQMVDGAVKKAEAAFTDTHVKPLQAENKVYKDRLDRVATVENIMFKDAERFVGILKSIKDDAGNPIYDKYFGAGDGKAAAVAEPAELAALGARPEADGVNADGTKGYTPEGFQKLLDWVSKDASIRATAAAEAKIGKRLTPFEEAAKKQQEDRNWQQRTAETLDAAAGWPGFTKNADAILKALQDDKELKLDLPAAYRQVVFENNRVNEDKMRAKILQELKAAPRGTATGARAKSADAARAAAAEEPKSLEDVVRQAAKAAGVL